MTNNSITQKLFGLILIALSIGICACGEKISDQNSTNDNNGQVKQRTLKDPKDPINCSDSVQNHIIDGAVALRYITAFWTDPTCVSFGEKYGAGEYVALDTSNYGFINPIPGMSIFPCISNMPLQDIYFAFKKDTICPVNGEVEISDRDNFLISNLNFPGFKANDRIYDSIRSKLVAAQVPKYLLFRPDSIFDGNLVSNMNQDYIANFRSNQDYCMYGFGFMKDTNVEDVLRQTYGNRIVVGFWTFFGFDEGAIPQKIRLVIIPVDQNGKMILEEESCLEKSWPPIMPNTIIRM